MLIVIERKRKEVEGGWSKKRGHSMVAPREAGTHIIVSVSLLKHLWGQFLLNREEGRCQTCNKKGTCSWCIPNTWRQQNVYKQIRKKKKQVETKRKNAKYFVYEMQHFSHYYDNNFFYVLCCI